VANAGFSLRLPRNLEFFFDVSNLFDEPQRIVQFGTGCAHENDLQRPVCEFRNQRPILSLGAFADGVCSRASDFGAVAAAPPGAQFTLSDGVCRMPIQPIQNAAETPLAGMGGRIRREPAPEKKFANSPSNRAATRLRIRSSPSFLVLNVPFHLTGALGRTLLAVLLPLAGFSLRGAAPEEDLMPLSSAASQGLGPISLPGLSHTIVGAASVFRSARPDLFVMTHGRASGFYLFRYLRTGGDGAPIFVPPRPLATPFADGKGTIVETPDGIIHGLWLEKNLLHLTTFDRISLTFTGSESVTLTGLASGAQSVAAFPIRDGRIRPCLRGAGRIHARPQPRQQRLLR